MRLASVAYCFAQVPGVEAVCSSPASVEPFRGDLSESSGISTKNPDFMAKPGLQIPAALESNSRSRQKRTAMVSSDDTLPNSCP